MYANALPNVHRFAYDASRAVYWVRETDPAKQYNLIGGPPLFGPPQRPPPPGPNQPPRIDTPRLTIDESTPKQQPPGTPVATPGTGTSGAFVASPGVLDKHRKKPDFSAVDALVAGISNAGRNKKFSDDAITLSPGSPGVPPPTAPGKPGPRLVFDEGAKKNPSAGGESRTTEPSSSNILPGDASFSGSGSSQGLTFDENAAKGANAPGGKGASGLAFDESAAKGANLGGGTPRPGETSPGPSVGFGAAIGGDVQAGNSILDDDFFKKIGKMAQEERQRRRQTGASLRSSRGRVVE
jgi:hypothetical protein